MPRPAPGEIERRLGDLMDDLDKIARPDVPGHEIRTFYTSIPRYTTLLRAIELWRSVQADGPGRLAGDEEPPPGDGLVVCRKQDLSQQIKADAQVRRFGVRGGVVRGPVIVGRGPVYGYPRGYYGYRRGYYGPGL